MTRCSACNELNPADHQFCGYCGNRLSAPSTNATPIIPAQQAPSAPGATHAEALPSWLYDAQLASPNITQPTPPPPERARKHDPNETSPALPFWLNDDATGTVSGDQAPASPNSTAAQPLRTDDALPPWLRNDGSEGTNNATATPSQAEPPANISPRTMGEETLTPATTTASDDALPPWLLGETTATVERGTTPPLGNVAPSTPQTTDAASTPPANSAAPAPARDESLSWLMDTQPTVAASTASVPSDTNATVSNTNAADELPDWLRDDLSTPAAEAEPTTTQPLPSWLRNDPFVAPTSAASTAEPTPGPTAAPQRSPAPSGGDADSLPAWLRDERPAVDGGSVTVELPVSTPEPAAAPPNTEDAAPPPADTTTDEALPAWLQAQTTTPVSDEPTPAPVAEAQQEMTPPAPEAAARVYDTATQETAPPPEPTPAPEPTTGGVAVYDVPEAPMPSEDRIAALLAGTTAPSAPVETTQPVAPAPAAQPTEPSTPAPTAAPTAPVSERRAPTATPQRAQRGIGLWIVLALVLLIAVLAVGWLAFQFNF